MNTITIILVGESFRMGNQHTRIRDVPESINEQLLACKSHVDFFENLIAKYNTTIKVIISSYTTVYKNKLMEFYDKYDTIYQFEDELIGIEQSIKNVYNYIQFDTNILLLRIDLFLKQKLMDLFNPFFDKILYPSICFFPYDICKNNYPRVNDMFTYIPHKYLYKIDVHKIMNHDGWYILCNLFNLKYNDIDVLINTYHDSNSYKCWNPLYKIVNRLESENNNPLYNEVNKDEFEIWYSKDLIFNKYDIKYKPYEDINKYNWGIVFDYNNYNNDTYYTNNCILKIKDNIFEFIKCKTYKYMPFQWFGFNSETLKHISRSGFININFDIMFLNNLIKKNDGFNIKTHNPDICHNYWLNECTELNKFYSIKIELKFVESSIIIFIFDDCFSEVHFKLKNIKFT